MRRRRTWLVSTLAVLATGLTLSATASATMALSGGVYPRRNGSGQQRLAACTANTSGCPAPPNCGINANNCYDTGASWTFSFQLGGITFNSLMVFGASSASSSSSTTGGGSISCADYNNRVTPSGTTPVCHLIAVFSYADVVGHEFSIPDAAMISAFEGTPVTNGDPSTVDRDAVCKGTTGDMDPTLSTLSFFLAGSSDPFTQQLSGNAGEEFTYNVYWDVIGPAAPMNLTAQAADTAVELDWQSTSSSSSSGGVTVPPPCLLGYQPYAVPLPYTGAIPDASIADTFFSSGDTDVDTFVDDTAPAPTDSGDEVDTTVDDTAPVDTGTASTTDAGTSSDATSETSSGGGCGPTPLVEGYHPGPELDPYKKGDPVNAAATSLRVDGLTNYTYYSLSLGATDTFGNVGPLAAPTCAQPKDTVDFFDAYRGAGGLAGGGYCAFGRRPVEVVGGSVALLALAGLIARRARRAGSKRGAR